jgi:hypothetical protein
VLTKIKTLEILSTTITDIIRNDLNLMQSVLHESALTIGSLMSEKALRSKQWIREDHITDNVDFYNDNDYEVNQQVEFMIEDFDKNGYYTRPYGHPISEMSLGELETHETCGLAVPFMGAYYKKFNFMHYYEDTLSASSFIGFPNGMWCNGPLTSCACYTVSMSDPNYSCPREEIPGWDPKFYSPICRGWYKDQAAAFSPDSPRGILSYLYLYMSGQIGATACAPINIDLPTGETIFGGASCIDIVPGGPISDYLDEKDTYYFIYSPDTAFQEENYEESNLLELINLAIFGGEYDLE